MVDFLCMKILVWWALPGRLPIVCELKDSSSFYPVALLSQRPSLLAWERERDHGLQKHLNHLMNGSRRGTCHFSPQSPGQNSVMLFYPVTKRAGKGGLSSRLGEKVNTCTTISSILATLKFSVLCPQKSLVML